MSSISRVRTLVLMACLAGLGAAQRDIVVVAQNLAPHARDEWASAVLPFARGEVAADARPERHLDGLATVWQPFGARWPDGSWRQALCLFRAPLEPLGERHLSLIEGSGPPLPDEPVTLPADLRLECVLRVAGATTEAPLARVETLEANAARTVELWRGRVGDSGLLCEAILTAWRDQPHLDADVGVFFSDPRLASMAIGIDDLAVRSHGLALVLRHDRLFGVSTTENGDRDGSTCSLLRACQLGDGQGIRRTGVLVPPFAALDAQSAKTMLAAVLCPVLAATDRWTETGTWGAFGVVPAADPDRANVHALRARLAQRHAAFVRGETAARGDAFWGGPLGPTRNPSQTGDQLDFAVAKLGVVAGTGFPSPLYEVEASVLQEACRPVHFFEADGAPVRSERHPQWVVWSGRTHWHCQVSADRLGKPCPEPRFERNGWYGKDREHWSSNYAAGLCLLTGAHWLRRELQNETELFLAGETIDPSLTTSGAGAARGVGRTLLAGCWLYLCTGDARLWRRIGERLEHVIAPAWSYRTDDPARVRPLMVCDPDARMLDGQHRYWNPWQEAIAVMGLGAVHRLTGDARARELAAGLGTNVVRHGFKVDEREAVIATAIVWRDGAPIPEPELLAGDKAVVVWSYGTAFSEWALPAVALTAIYAAEDGDEATAARAREILDRLRRKPSPRLPEWDCVR
ncbi:MAG: hypothetical protein R3F56_08565 [Planctomycetota bacterium]